MRFCWTTIHVRDMEASLAFYTGVVGLTVKRRMSPMPGMEIAFLGFGAECETEVELIYHEGVSAATFGEDISIGFRVDTLEKMLDTLNLNGVPLHAGPSQPNPHVRFLYVLDPNGLKIQFVEQIGD